MDAFDEHVVRTIIKEELKELAGGDIRRIVREELKSLLESMDKTADRADGYETGELESAGLRAIRRVVEDEAYYMPHAWTCPKRQGAWDNNGDPTKCNCGVGEDD